MNKEKPAKPVKSRPSPAEVVKGIMKDYPRRGQERILELLNQKLSPPNPYGNNNLRG